MRAAFVRLMEEQGYEHISATDPRVKGVALMISLHIPHEQALHIGVREVLECLLEHYWERNLSPLYFCLGSPGSEEDDDHTWNVYFIQ